MYYYYGVPKYLLSRKAFGVYRHRTLEPTSPFLRGFSDDLLIPVSRWTEIRRDSLPSSSGIRTLIDSPETGICLLDDPSHRALHMFNHIEYDSESLSDEYFRDFNNGVSSILPYNYFSMDNPSIKPKDRWRCHAHLFFSNWLNEIYQTVPFDISRIGSSSQRKQNSMLYYATLG